MGRVVSATEARIRFGELMQQVAEDKNAQAANLVILPENSCYS